MSLEDLEIPQENLEFEMFHCALFEEEVTDGATEHDTKPFILWREQIKRMVLDMVFSESFWVLLIAV